MTALIPKFLRFQATIRNLDRLQRENNTLTERLESVSFQVIYYFLCFYVFLTVFNLLFFFVFNLF